MANASVLSNYTGCRFNFTDRLGNKASIDTTTKPLTIENANGLGELKNLQPASAGALVNEFTCDFDTLDSGIFEADIVADVDITPEAESELRVHVTIAIMPGQATAIGFSLGTEVPKEAAPQ